MEGAEPEAAPSAPRRPLREARGPPQLAHAQLCTRLGDSATAPGPWSTPHQEDPVTKLPPHCTWPSRRLDAAPRGQGGQGAQGAHQPPLSEGLRTSAWTPEHTGFRARAELKGPELPGFCYEAPSAVSLAKKGPLWILRGSRELRHGPGSLLSRPGLWEMSASTHSGNTARQS